MELTISQLIKILLGVFVVIAVVIGLYVFFKDKVLGFFKNLPGGGNVSNLIFSLLK